MATVTLQFRNTNLKLCLVIGVAKRCDRNEIGRV